MVVVGSSGGGPRAQPNRQPRLVALFEDWCPYRCREGCAAWAAKSRGKKDIDTGENQQSVKKNKIKNPEEEQISAFMTT